MSGGSRRFTRSQQFLDESSNEDDNAYPSTSTGISRHLSQDSGERKLAKNSVRGARVSGRNVLSQGDTGVSKNVSSQEEIGLANKVIRYVLAVEHKKHVIRKSYIAKNVLGGGSGNFHRVMEKVQSFLSEIFGYKLTDIGGGKYILVNELRNDMPHLKFTKAVKSQQVLLFVVLAQIFMTQDTCGEETLWDFLRRLDIVREENFQHDYFGDVEKLVTADFVAQQYLEKVTIGKGDSKKYEYKWGPRAEREVSRRDVLEFVSRVYDGREINSWPGQYKEMMEKERSDES